MKIFYKLLLPFLPVIKKAGLFIFVMAGSLLFGQQGAVPIKGRILVKPTDGTSDQEFKSLISLHGGQSIQHNPYINLHIVSVPENAEDAIVNALSKNPKIQFAERDMLVPPSVNPNDPQFSSQWHHVTMQTPEAWDISKGAGIKITIMDTGIDTAHTDLKDKIVLTYNATGNTTNPDDVPDFHGHGTKVAGTAAASTDNAIGVAGTAWGSSLIIVKVDPANDGYASWSALASGITFGANNGARVASMSYEASQSSSVISAAQYMKNKTNGLSVCAAGNAGTVISGNDVPDIITVAATAGGDVRASYSNYGKILDVSAPGSGILTTIKGGGYGSVNGTSFATPNTAGVIALIMAADPTLTAAQVENILESTADDLGDPGYDTLFGHGRINAFKAVKAAAGCGVTVSPSASGICEGGSITLTATGGSGSFTWSPATGLDVTTGSSVVATPTVTTTYTATDGSGCPKPVTVSVTQKPVVSVTPPTTQICSGVSVTLTAGGANTYSWSPPTGLSATFGTAVYANPTATTTYTVTGTTNGCTSTSTATITVNPGTAPNVTVTASATNICGGSNSTLTASGTAVSYSWLPVSGLNTITGTVVSASPANTTTYTVTGTDGNCSASSMVTINVSGSAPTISVSPVTTILCATSSVTLTASGPGGATYTWAPSTGLNTTSGKNVTASPSTLTTYTVTGTKNGCFNTAQATVSPCATATDPDIVSDEEGIILYPNPATNSLHIKMKNNNGQPINIVFYNSLGELIYKSSTQLNSIVIDLSGFPTGIYFIEVISTDGFTGKSRLMINR